MLGQLGTVVGNGWLKTIMGNTMVDIAVDDVGVNILVTAIFGMMQCLIHGQYTDHYNS